MIHNVRHTGSGFLAVVAALAVAASVTACGDSGDDDARFAAAAEKAATSTTTAVPALPEGVPPAGEPSQTSTTATAQPVPADPTAALYSAVAAYQSALGAQVPTLQFTIYFPVGDDAYASLQSQDPSQPANIDERNWRDGRVGDPSPVKLTGANAPLPERLFPLDQVNWVAVAAALPGAPGLVQQKLGVPLENSDGVTHLIATSDLPFSPNKVVRIYVDGGDRTTGGYVQYLADGRLDKVQA